MLASGKKRRKKEKKCLSHNFALRAKLIQTQLRSSSEANFASQAKLTSLRGEASHCTEAKCKMPQGLVSLGSLKGTCA